MASPEPLSGPPAEKRRRILVDGGQPTHDPKEGEGAKLGRTAGCSAIGADKACELQRLWLHVLGGVVSSDQFPPRPTLEIARRRDVLRLRRLYMERVRELGTATEAPRESFNRWLIERANNATTSSGVDPILGVCGKGCSEGLRREVLASLPVLLPRTAASDSAGWHRNLRRYALEAQALLKCGSAGEKFALAACSEALSMGALASEGETPKAGGGDGASVVSGARERLERLRHLCAPALDRLLGGAVARLCEELDLAADECAAGHRRRLANGGEIPVQDGNEELIVTASLDIRRGVYLLTARAAAADAGDMLTPPRADEGVGSDGDEYRIGDGCDIDNLEDEVFVVSVGCLDRLAKAFRCSARVATEVAKTPDAPATAVAAAEFFAAPGSLWSLVFCMLCRYDALCGPGPKEGGGLQAALPPEVFDALALDAGGGSCVECFASPLTCRQAGWRYCSLFGDLDVFVGSLGSFFGSSLLPEFIGGVFQINPPFSPGVVERLTDKLLAALSRAEAIGTSLQFTVFLPGVPTAAASSSGVRSAIDRLMESPFTCASTKVRHQRFVFGLSFRTDHVWPPFLVRSRCVLLRTTRGPSTGVGSGAALLGGAAWVTSAVASLARVCNTWAGGKGTDDGDEESEVVTATCDDNSDSARGIVLTLHSD